MAGSELLIDSLELPDMKDRHVLAAAIICGAQLIVTDNVNDFPDLYLSKFSISAITPDEFSYLTHILYPAPSLEALKKLRKSYKNPPFSESEFIMDLMKKGLPKFATSLKPNRNFL